MGKVLGRDGKEAQVYAGTDGCEEGVQVVAGLPPFPLNFMAFNLSVSEG